MAMAAVPLLKGLQVMENDDMSWWHQLDLEMQEREEQERIDACNKAINEMKEKQSETI